MRSFILILCILSVSSVFAMNYYTQVYVVQKDTSLAKILKEVGASELEKKEIIKLNPQLERLDYIPAGTIINLSLYREDKKSKIRSSLKKIKMIKHDPSNSKLVLSPLIGSGTYNTSLNLNSEIVAKTMSYGLGLNYESIQTSQIAVQLDAKIKNTTFTNLEIKKTYGKNYISEPNQSRFDYEVGITGIFNRSNTFNDFNFSLTRKVENLLYFSKKKNFYTSNEEDFIDMTSFQAWWLGAEFTQSLPFFSLPIEAKLGYGFTLDGSLNIENDSELKSLNGSKSHLALNWKDNKSTYGFKYETQTYRSDFVTNLKSLSLYANFEI